MFAKECQAIEKSAGTLMNFAKGIRTNPTPIRMSDIDAVRRNIVAQKNCMWELRRNLIKLLEGFDESFKV